MKKSRLPLFPSSNIKPFSFLIVSKCTKRSHRIRNYSYLPSEDFKPKAVFVKVLCEFCNSMHVAYCLMISNTILVDATEYMFTFDGLQNFH